MEQDTNKSDVVFIDGLHFDKPHENAPDFIKGRISIHAKRLVDWMRENKQYMSENGFFNLDLKKSKAGKLYLAVNTFKPEKKEEVPTADDIGF